MERPRTEAFDSRRRWIYDRDIAMTPKVIGPYSVLERLGSGGAGTVYRALDRRNGELAALKLLSRGHDLHPKASRRLAREFETLQSLSHTNIVKVYDTGVFHGFPYLVMELVEGLMLRQYLSLSDEDLTSDSALAHAIAANAQTVYGSATNMPSDSETSQKTPLFDLAKYVVEAPSEVGEMERREHGSASLRFLLPEPGFDANDAPRLRSAAFNREPEAPSVDALPARPSAEELADLNRPQRVGRLKDAMLQLCKALAYVHSAGLIHRDLKPSNVMVDEDRAVRLMDFGLAKYISEEGIVSGDERLVGTIRYMAPEQILGERLDSRTDLYALGVILYELVTGRAPFSARSPYELWRKALETEPPEALEVNERADRTLGWIAHRLIRKDPADRFQTAEEVYEALVE